MTTLEHDIESLVLRVKELEEKNAWLLSKRKRHVERAMELEEKNTELRNVINVQRGQLKARESIVAQLQDRLMDQAKDLRKLGEDKVRLVKKIKNYRKNAKRLNKAMIEKNYRIDQLEADILDPKAVAEFYAEQFWRAAKYIPEDERPDDSGKWPVGSKDGI